MSEQLPGEALPEGQVVYGWRRKRVDNNVEDDWGYFENPSAVSNPEPDPED